LSENVPDLSNIASEQQKKAATDPALQGAADLSNPLLEKLRSFITDIAPYKPVTVFAIAMTENGQIVSTGDGVGGPVQILGMLQIGEYLVMQRLSSARPPNMPN